MRLDAAANETRCDRMGDTAAYAVAAFRCTAPFAAGDATDNSTLATRAALTAKRKNRRCLESRSMPIVVFWRPIVTGVFRNVTRV